MSAQLIERELVDIQLVHAVGEQCKVRLCLWWEIIDLVKLVNADVASQLAAIRRNLSGIVAAYAWHGLVDGGVGRVQVDVLAGSNLLLAVILPRIILARRSLLASRSVAATLCSRPLTVAAC